jgi:CAAX protease family protein
LTDRSPGSAPGRSGDGAARGEDQQGSPEEPAAGPDPTAQPYGLFRFTIEGRRAPGLFVAGWLATLLGGIGAFVGLLAGQTPAGAILFVVGLAVLLGGLLLMGGSQTVERRAAGLAYWGPSPIVVFGATIAGLYLAVVIVATPLGLLGVTLDGPALSLFGVALQAVVVLVILRMLVVGSGSLSWREMGLRASLPAAVRDLAWGGMFALPVIVLTLVVVAGLVTVVGSTPESPLPPSGSAAGLAINLLAGAVIAPVYEELLFRGFATTAWARMISPAAAISRAAILFALAHVLTQGGESFGQALGLAVVAAGARIPVAFVLGWVYLRRGSLWASIGLHAAFNAILLILAEVAVQV